jgi:hypothetical protein
LRLREFARERTARRLKDRQRSMGRHDLDAVAQLRRDVDWQSYGEPLRFRGALDGAVFRLSTPGLAIAWAHGKRGFAIASRHARCSRLLQRVRSSGRVA